MSDRREFEGECVDCKAIFFPMRCDEHHLLMLSYRLQRDRIEALEGAVRAMVRAVDRPGVLFAAGDAEMRTALTIAATVMPEFVK